MMSGADEVDHDSPLDRRHGDERLLAALRRVGLRGPVFDDFVIRVTGYAAGVLWKMVQGDEIWDALAKINRPRSRPFYWGEHDKEHLVKDSVADGFLDFHKNILVEGRWSPARASVNTVIIRYCLGKFADHYTVWERQSLARSLQESRSNPEFWGTLAPSAERAALAKQAVTKLSMEQFAHGAGYSHKEIGQMLGISERAVEGRLYRGRGKDSASERG